MRILIIGVGGQGQVIADAVIFSAEAGRNIDVIGYLDDNPALWQQEFLGYKVLGPIDKWKDVKHDALIIGLGDNKIRREYFLKLLDEGAVFTNVCHPKAVIGHDVIIGDGSSISAHVIIAAGTVVGYNSIIHGNSVIGHHNIIGDHVHIAPGVNTAGHVEIGTGVLVGIGATVMPQRKIGDWAVVGSATLVQRDVLPGLKIVGVPGMPLKK